MRYIGIDYGEKRIGLSFADELGLAMPLDAAVEPIRAQRISHVLKVVKERRAEALVVGYPLNMDGTEGPKVKEVEAFIAELQSRCSLPIHRIDERLTSHQAEQELKAVAKKKPKSIKEHQAIRASGVIDSRAAAILLQDFLDASSPPLLPPEPEDLG